MTTWVFAAWLTASVAVAGLAGRWLLRRAGTRDLFVVLASGFAVERTAPGLMRMLAHALQAGDPARLARLAHTLRSACAQVGAARLADLAGRLERAASASAPGIASLVHACARELEDLLSVLAELTEHEA